MIILNLDFLGGGEGDGDTDDDHAWSPPFLVARAYHHCQHSREGAWAEERSCLRDCRVKASECYNMRSHAPASTHAEGGMSTKQGCQPPSSAGPAAGHSFGHLAGVKGSGGAAASIQDCDLGQVPKCST